MVLVVVEMSLSKPIYRVRMPIPWHMSHSFNHMLGKRASKWVMGALVLESFVFCWGVNKNNWGLAIRPYDLRVQHKGRLVQWFTRNHIQDMLGVWQVAEAFLALGWQEDWLDACEKTCKEGMKYHHQRMLIMEEEFKEQNKTLKGEITLVKEEMVQSAPSATYSPPSKGASGVPEPKPFGGARSPRTWRTSSKTWSQCF